ncbi:hypothetical protein [Actinospica robiniae]|uniref:hypothetical protein n=1 Tax=Actinospica robiniae TaxID=304901 RepID=UPI0003FE6123|nr:hypothetical protein [Actinospica robiniae]
MEIPGYWLRGPELRRDDATVSAVDRFLDQALEQGPDRPIDYTLDLPKWQFLCHAIERANVVLHGSGDPGIDLFEPRQAADSLEFSNRCAVYAAADGIWPVYFAILDRARHPMLLCNAAVRLGSGDEELSGPYYFFSITDTALQRRPWRTGTVYLLSADGFEHQPPFAVGDAYAHVAQAACPVPVKPLAKLAVGPEDFPFLAEIRGHRDEQLQARIAADPGGFPWVEE